MIKHLWLLLLTSPAYSDLVTIANVYSKGEKCPMESITATDGAYMLMNCPKSQMTYKYDLKAQSLFIMAKGSKNCLPMSKKQMEQMSKVRAQQAKQMEAMKGQLQQMPPEQRKMIEASLGNLTAGPAIPELKRTSRQETVKKWNCQVYDQVLNGKKVGEQCLASAKDVGLDDTKYKRVTDFVEEMSKLSAGQTKATDSFKLFRDGLVVVQGKTLENGKMNLAFELEKVTEESGRYNSVPFSANCASK